MARAIAVSQGQQPASPALVESVAAAGAVLSSGFASVFVSPSGFVPAAVVPAGEGFDPGGW